MSRDPARHQLDLFPSTIWVAHGDRQLRRVGKLGGPKGLDPEGCAGRTWSATRIDSGHHVVVLVAKGQKGRALVNTCAHEASHAADAVFEFVDEEAPGVETRAYLVGWVAEFLIAHCAPGL